MLLRFSSTTWATERKRCTGFIPLSINGYAFRDTDGLVKVVERVQQEGRKIPDLQTAYPNVTFRSKSEWESANTDLADGMSKLISTLKEKKDDIRRQRIQQGIEEKFSKLTNKELAGR